MCTSTLLWIKINNRAVLILKNHYIHVCGCSNVGDHQVHSRTDLIFVKRIGSTPYQKQIICLYGAIR